jgi:hypothetical protein
MYNAYKYISMVFEKYLVLLQYTILIQYEYI